MDKIKSSIFQILAEQFSVPSDEISEKIGPGDLSAWDSLGQMQLIMRLEKQYNLQLSVEDVMSINNVNDIITLVRKQVSGSALLSVEEKSSPKLTATSSSALKLPKLTSWGNGSLITLRKISKKNVAILTGSSSYVAKLKKILQKHIPVEVNINFIAKPEGEPRERDILQLAEKLSGISPDLIIALGGGSCLDLAKLGWALYENPSLQLADIVKPFSLPPLRKKASFIAVPTTFGSGSEASSAATFSKEGNGSKIIIISHELLPDEVILDPQLGESLSLSILYAGVFDALTHAIEGYVSAIDNPLVDPYAIYAIRNIIETLQKVQTEGITLTDLQKFCYSAYFAGIVQNHCSVGLTHSIAHQLGKYGISHGIANALFLTTVMVHNAKGTKKYAKLAVECGFATLEKMINVIDNLLENAKILPNSETCREIIENKTLIVELAMRDPTFNSNPISLEKGEIESLFSNFKKKFIE